MARAASSAGLDRKKTLKVTGQMGKEHQSHVASNRLSIANSSVQHPYASSSSPPRPLPIFQYGHLTGPSRHIEAFHYHLMAVLHQ